MAVDHNRMAGRGGERRRRPDARAPASRRQAGSTPAPARPRWSESAGALSLRNARPRDFTSARTRRRSADSLSPVSANKLTGEEADGRSPACGDEASKTSSSDTAGPPVTSEYPCTPAGDCDTAAGSVRGPHGLVNRRHPQRPVALSGKSRVNPQGSPPVTSKGARPSNRASPPRWLLSLGERLRRAGGTTKRWLRRAVLWRPAARALRTQRRRPPSVGTACSETVVGVNVTSNCRAQPAEPRLDRPWSAGGQRRLGRHSTESIRGAVRADQETS